MHATYGMALLLVREIFGLPLDLVLVFFFVAVMLGLIVAGSRPSVIARYRNRSAPGDEPRDGGEENTR